MSEQHKVGINIRGTSFTEIFIPYIFGAAQYCRNKMLGFILCCLLLLRLWLILKTLLKLRRIAAKEAIYKKNYKPHYSTADRYRTTIASSVTDITAFS